MPENNKQVNFARLVDWMEGRLPEDEARTVEEALAGADSATLTDAAWLGRFFEATEDVVIEAPPPELRSALVDTFEAHARGRRTGGFVRRVLAGLAFDSNLQPAVGLRAVGAKQSRRQLIYHADTFDLAVNLLAREADNDLDLDGQVLPREGETPDIFSVQLVRDGSEMALTVVDEMGSFALQRIPPGAYELILSSERVEISVLPVDVGL
ncbi:MAG: hypothetical protein H0U55_15760 [Rubrobacteraceae bacterium]|nr:hypothetical protein [Rubrobacteraceae bacterium]